MRFLQPASWFFVLLTAACLAKDSHGLPTGVITYQQILARPEGHLFFPGSHVVEVHGDGEIADSLEGNRPAYVETYLTTSASRQEVEDWYRSQLTKAGWATDSQTQASQSYARDTRESFTIWFIQVAPKGVQWDGRGTLYSIDYQIAPCSQSGVIC